MCRKGALTQTDWLYVLPHKIVNTDLNPNIVDDLFVETSMWHFDPHVWV